MSVSTIPTMPPLGSDIRATHLSKFSLFRPSTALSSGSDPTARCDPFQPPVEPLFVECGRADDRFNSLAFGIDSSCLCLLSRALTPCKTPQWLHISCDFSEKKKKAERTRLLREALPHLTTAETFLLGVNCILGSTKVRLNFDLSS